MLPLRTHDLSLFNQIRFLLFEEEEEVHVLRSGARIERPREDTPFRLPFGNYVRELEDFPGRDLERGPLRPELIKVGPGLPQVVRWERGAQPRLRAVLIRAWAGPTPVRRELTLVNPLQESLFPFDRVGLEDLDLGERPGMEEGLDEGVHNVEYHWSVDDVARFQNLKRKNAGSQCINKTQAENVTPSVRNQQWGTNLWVISFKNPHSLNQPLDHGTVSYLAVRESVKVTNHDPLMNVDQGPGRDERLQGLVDELEGWNHVTHFNAPLQVPLSNRLEIFSKLN